MPCANSQSRPNNAMDSDGAHRLQCTSNRSGKTRQTGKPHGRDSARAIQSPQQEYQQLKKNKNTNESNTIQRDHAKKLVAIKTRTGSGQTVFAQRIETQKCRNQPNLRRNPADILEAVPKKLRTKNISCLSPLLNTFEPN